MRTFTKRTYLKHLELPDHSDSDFTVVDHEKMLSDAINQAEGKGKSGSSQVPTMTKSSKNPSGEATQQATREKRNLHKITESDL